MWIFLLWPGRLDWMCNVVFCRTCGTPLWMRSWRAHHRSLYGELLGSRVYHFGGWSLLINNNLSYWKLFCKIQTIFSLGEVFPFSTAEEKTVFHIRQLVQAKTIRIYKKIRSELRTAIRISSSWQVINFSIIDEIKCILVMVALNLCLTRTQRCRRRSMV